MSWLRKLEQQLSSWWEGLGRQGAKTAMQPVEIAKVLLREMSTHKKVSVRRTYVPNRYLVYLSPADWNALSAMETALTEELAAYLQEKATERGYTLVGRVEVRLEVEENLPPGRLRVHSRFSEEEAPAPPETEGTRPFPTAVPPLALRVVKGPDAGRTFSLTARENSLGRRPTCQVVLSDVNVSRLHAVIERQADGYWISDLGSTNGTFVNGQKVARQPLRQGDHIRVGDSELEVGLP